MKKILVINGPNLNMLGIREPDLYGKQDFKALCKYIKACAKEIGCKVRLYQSNHEGDLVTAIQKSYGKMDGIVINPGAYTHTSVALLDAVKACGVPTVEVHLTDISAREEFRQISYISAACETRFAGLGFTGYKKALEFLCER
ncbi:MAG: type II 3-dehydroquinate dehydratase [Ruminococcaceae bacterium]|nr:type II 3-dehydroquinate dehydratase [Oscillospiraceae bacterium]